MADLTIQAFADRQHSPFAAGFTVRTDVEAEIFHCVVFHCVADAAAAAR
jgi:predicted phage gp36 major capsid-like protein